MSGVRKGTVYLVGAGPGDPDLITVRGLELLAGADAVLHDELVAPSLLGRVQSGALVEYVGKRGSEPRAKQLKQVQIDARLIELARSGLAVVRLKGGDPFLFGRGSEEAEALAASSIPFEIVPGVCSPIAAAAYAGISLTHRDLASSVVFLSGTTQRGEPFDLRELAGHRGTVCILMGLKRLPALCLGLRDVAGRLGSTPVAVIEKGTRPDQRVVVGTLEDIAQRARDARLETPALVVVGDVVGLRQHLRWFDSLPLAGKRVLVTRAEQQTSELLSLLRRRAAEAVEFALIALADAPDPEVVRSAARSLASYDLLAFTSDNGVERFMSVLRELGKDARAFGPCRVAAIGEGTTRALARHGIRPDVLATTSRGEGLAACILEDLASRRGGASGARVLLPRALVAREVMPDALRAAGVQVDVVPVYRTQPASAERREELIGALRRREIDMVMLTSASMVDSLCDLLGDEASQLLADVTIGSIGPVTTEAAQRRGLSVAVTAPKSTVEALVTALEEHPLQA